MFKRKSIPYLFILPFFAMFALFKVYPLIYGFWMSLNKISITGGMDFIGLRNYALLLSNPRFYHTLRVIGFYTLGQGTIHLFLALVVALLLNIKFKGRTFYRSAFFLPVVTSLVVAAMFWRILLDEHIGLVNAFLTKLGLPGYGWLEEPQLILPSVIIVGVWRWFGFQMVILLAGLQSIPNELYDAAKVDGASSFQITCYVTLPLLFPVIFFCIAMILIGDLMLFDIPYVLAGPGGGPNENALSTAMYLYRSAFNTFRMGYAAALGYLLALLIMSVSIFYIRVLGKKAGLK